MNAEKPFLICIAGRSSSGKTTIVKNLILLLKQEKIKMEEIITIKQDNYYNSNYDISEEKRKKMNYDHPSAFDDKLLVKNLKLLMEYKEISSPIYDFSKNSRLKNKENIIKPGRIIFLEGIMAYENLEIRKMSDLLVFIDIESDVCLARRINRDIAERKRNINYILNQYFEFTKPGYEQFIHPLKKYADIIIPEGGEKISSLKLFFGNLMWKLSKKQND